MIGCIKWAVGEGYARHPEGRFQFRHARSQVLNLLQRILNNDICMCMMACIHHQATGQGHSEEHPAHIFPLSQLTTNKRKVTESQSTTNKRKVTEYKWRICM